MVRLVDLTVAKPACNGASRRTAARDLAAVTVLGFGIAVAFLTGGCATTPAAPPAPATSADYSAVDTADKALLLSQSGELRRVALDPLVHSGRPEGANAVFLPAKVAEELVAIGARITAMNRSSQITRYDIKPAYMGNSIVPVRIQVKAVGEGGFMRRLEVWAPPAGAELVADPGAATPRAPAERSVNVPFSP